MSARIQKLVDELIRAVRDDERVSIFRSLTGATPQVLNGHAKPRRRKYTKRPTVEIRDLGQRAIEYIGRNPGLQIGAIASALKVKPPELLRPMFNAKKAGQIVAIGAKQNTVYFTRDQAERATAPS